MTKYEVIPQKVEAHFFGGLFTHQEAEELATLVGGEFVFDRIQPDRSDYWMIQFDNAFPARTGDYIAMFNGGPWQPRNRAGFEKTYRKVAE